VHKITNKPNKPNKPNKQNKPNKPNKPNKSNKQYKPNKPNKPNKSNKQYKPNKQYNGLVECVALLDFWVHREHSILADCLFKIRSLCADCHLHHMGRISRVSIDQGSNQFKQQQFHKGSVQTLHAGHLCQTCRTHKHACAAAHNHHRVSSAQMLKFG